MEMPKPPEKFRKKEAEFGGRTASSVVESLKEKAKGLVETEEIQPGQDLSNADISNLKFPDEIDIGEPDLKLPDEVGVEPEPAEEEPKKKLEMPAMPARFKKFKKEKFIDTSLKEGQIKAETEAVKPEEVYVKPKPVVKEEPKVEPNVEKPKVEEKKVEVVEKPKEEIKPVEEKPVPKLTPRPEVKEVKPEVPKVEEQEEVQIELPDSKPELTEAKPQVEEAKEEKLKVSMEEEIPFKIDLRPKFIKLPEIKDKTEINIKYPLVSPYAYAHIFWNVKTKELIYYVEEPVMNKEEQELMSLVKVALEEMINVGFYNASNAEFVSKYLQMNVQAILIELNVKITDKTYQKLMYYIYRDFVGMNEIDSLLRDYYIEDIECNGFGYPIYIVHRKYGNLRTNLIYESADQLADFVEKLAQKTGRYVSFAQPLLDGALPDGSRVNATYTKDITTRGPTFTIRKFTEEPWTPVHLIGFNTATAEVFAFLWLAVEHKFNVMVIGETGSGKTTFLNTILHFIPSESRVCSVEDTRELNLMHDNWLPAVQRLGFGIPNLAGEKYGEVSMFDLLKETFRQNPDYMVVGEVRGKEAYVLFQGMASGHPSFGTFHAGNVEAMIRRLQTPPINLSASLVETMDIVCMVTHVKTADKNMRRLREITEIKQVKESMGEFDGNNIFEWDASSDKITFNNKSVVFEKITKRVGITQAQLEKEFKIRTELLKKLQEKGMTNFRQFNEIVNSYYKDPKSVIKQLGL